MTSPVNIILIIAIIALLLWMSWSEKRKWETVYEDFSDKSNKIHKRYHYLKRKGIQCRLKNDSPGMIRMMGMQGAQMSKQSTIQLQVKKKEADMAYKYLAELDK